MAGRRPAEMEIPRPTGNQAGNKEFPGMNLKLLNMSRVVAMMESSYLENYMRFSDSTRFPNRRLSLQSRRDVLSSCHRFRRCVHARRLPHYETQSAPPREGFVEDEFELHLLTVS